MLAPKNPCPPLAFPGTQEARGCSDTEAGLCAAAPSAVPCLCSGWNVGLKSQGHRCPAGSGAEGVYIISGCLCSDYESLWFVSKLHSLQSRSLFWECRAKTPCLKEQRGRLECLPSKREFHPPPPPEKTWQGEDKASTLISQFTFTLCSARAGQPVM